MRKMKYVIGILILFMVIGFATVTVSLSISGNAFVTSNIDDFKVYFSNVIVNNEEDLSLVTNETTLEFSYNFVEPGESKIISYDVTNGSSLFDASISINCTKGDNYISVTNQFDTSNLLALSTRSGTLTIKKVKSNSSSNNTNVSVSCSIVASPISRDNQASGDIVAPVQPVTISTGDLISIEGENFNVISQTEDTVTMLAQYNLGTDYRQSTIHNPVSFSESNGWEYAPGPKEIDIQNYDGNVKNYVNNYVSYLKDLLHIDDIFGNLISLRELKELGCVIQDDYSYTGNETCANSKYRDWLINEQTWWTRSVGSDYDEAFIWMFYGDGFLVSSDKDVYFGYYYFNRSIRPVITIPTQLAKKYKLKTYEIGEEITISSEKFNVITDNGTTVTMFAQKNLGTNYRQSETINSVAFSYNNTWVYSPGPKEIDIQTYGSESKTYVNNYVTYLRSETGDSTLTGDLITAAELKKLGCTINDDYSESGNETCVNSPYISWINNSQNWWTRSAFPNSNGLVWLISYSRFSLVAPQGTGSISIGIRPVITISKRFLE